MVLPERQAACTGAAIDGTCHWLRVLMARLGCRDH
jgi:hypothetical protein